MTDPTRAAREVAERIIKGNPILNHFTHQWTVHKEQLQFDIEKASLAFHETGRQAALEEAEAFHLNEIIRLNEIDAHPPGLTQYGKDQRDWHHRAAHEIRRLASPAPKEEPHG